MNPSYLSLRNKIQEMITLTDDEWNLLLPYLKEKTLRKNSFFATEGKVAKEIGFIIQGNMRHYYTKDGEEKTTYFYFENHFVCDYISCISKKPGLLTIECLTDTTMVVFPYEKILACYQQSLNWSNFGRLIAEYLASGLEDRMSGLLLLSPEERYLQLLNSNKQKILERIPQHLIANYLGITPVSLSRIRNRIHQQK